MAAAGFAFPARSGVFAIAAVLGADGVPLYYLPLKKLCLVSTPPPPHLDLHLQLLLFFYLPSTKLLVSCKAFLNVGVVVV